MEELKLLGCTDVTTTTTTTPSNSRSHRYRDIADDNDIEMDGLHGVVDGSTLSSQSHSFRGNRMWNRRNAVILCTAIVISLLVIAILGPVLDRNFPAFGRNNNNRAPPPPSSETTVPPPDASKDGIPAVPSHPPQNTDDISESTTSTLSPGGRPDGEESSPTNPSNPIDPNETDDDTDNDTDDGTQSAIEVPTNGQEEELKVHQENGPNTGPATSPIAGTGSSNNNDMPTLTPPQNVVDNIHKESNHTTTLLGPPLAHREEGRVVYAGVPPPGWDLTIPRQSVGGFETDDDGVNGTGNNTHPHQLMDPPVPIPDPYGWMRDESRSREDVLEYLRAENDYTDALAQSFEVLSNILYEEMTSRMEETYYSFPVLDGDFYYYQRTVQNVSYPLRCRAPRPPNDGTVHDDGGYLKKHLNLWDGSSSAPILPGEVVFLDENLLSVGHDYFDIGSLVVSPSQELIAYTVDTKGNERYSLIIQRIDDQQIVFAGNDTLVVSDTVLWGADDGSIYYVTPDDSERPYQVYHRRWREGNEDLLLFEEVDVLFWVNIDKSKDGRFLLICTDSYYSSEVRYVDLTDPSTHVGVISGRRLNILYGADHHYGTWWLTGKIGDSPNAQLWTSKVGATSTEDWVRVRDPQTGQPLLDGIPIDRLTIFHGHIVVEGRENGLVQIWMIQVDDESNVLALDRIEWDGEAAHSIKLGTNKQFNTTKVVVEYESLVTPRQIVLVDLEQPVDVTGRMVVMESSVPGYTKDNYGCDRIHVPSRDGVTQIPVSLVYLRSTMERVTSTEQASQKVPLHLYAYGAYGVSIEDTFSSTRLSLLDRGMIYAIAHVRGGGENGWPWYDDGKLLLKKHTFEDFVDVARYLTYDMGWTTSELLSIEGRSAGGLTIGASMNEAPELFRVAILGVPFVDVVATMTDASIPLTSIEWEEWGNPNEKESFDYMMEYSPVNNVRTGAQYPSCLLLAGLFDPRVQFWEPAKFTASLRYGATNYRGNRRIGSDGSDDDDDISNNGGRVDRPICLKTDMTSGHFRASDRYEHIHSQAFDYSFVLWQLGLN